MPDPVITQRRIQVEHVRIEAAKPFAEVKAALEELLPPRNPAIPEALRQGDIGRRDAAAQSGACYLQRQGSMAYCCALPASRARTCSTR
jgi:hypothetical protein